MMTTAAKMHYPQLNIYSVKTLFLTLTLTASIFQNSYSATVYVDKSNTGATPPYSSWSTAAVQIQDAVNQATEGDIILVNNGTYSTGSSISPEDSRACRVVITNNITIRSLNGPSYTIIKGAPDPSEPNGLGSNAVRCVFMSSGALEGFTLTDGHTDFIGGGAYIFRQGTLNNCTIIHNSSKYKGGGVATDNGGVVTNCTISSNTADLFAGGVSLESGFLIDCIVSDNTANNNYGGGIMCQNEGHIIRCTINNNNSNFGGGGVYFVNSNGSTIESCILQGNTSGSGAGGMHTRDGTTINNCLIENNTSPSSGGVYLYGSTMNNCTVVNNSGGNFGDELYIGGDSSSYNSIFWNASSTKTIHGSGTSFTVMNSCASDGLTAGVNGCIVENPQFVDEGNQNYRLSQFSPCIDIGHNNYTLSNRDLNDQPRSLDGNADGSAITDMGAYEFLSNEVDSDADDSTDWEEYIAGTDAGDPNSFFAINEFTAENNDIILKFNALETRSYTVQFSASLWPPEWADIPSLTGMTGLKGLQEIPIDAPPQTNGFYRITTELP